MIDRTFCVSKSCPKADTCDRWWMNNLVTDDVISMFNPYKKGEKCEYYEESYRERYTEAICSKTDRSVAKRKRSGNKVVKKERRGV